MAICFRSKQPFSAKKGIELLKPRDSEITSWTSTVGSDVASALVGDPALVREFCDISETLQRRPLVQLFVLFSGWSSHLLLLTYRARVSRPVFHFFHFAVGRPIYYCRNNLFFDLELPPEA